MSHALWPYLKLLPLFPLVGAVVNGVFGPRLPRRAVHAIAVGAMVLATVAAGAAVATLLALPTDRRFLVDRLWTLFAMPALTVDFAFALDPLSAVMILVITIVGTAIHVYATAYMADEPTAWRFFAELNLFVFSMMLLVLGDSFVVLFFGWEGVGLCSYLLIGFWYSDERNARAGMKAFVTNRIGDWGFLVGMLALFWGMAEAGTATLSFRALDAQLGDPAVARALAAQELWGAPLPFVVGVALFIGMAGKSAQIPLYVWLPDAMAGPTPVSALIHAATMVTAGVYLVARLSFLFALTPGAMTVIATVGVATALLGALLALTETDLKRVLAYSTVSQLGFMFLAVGVGAWWVGIFHLVTHACFKACLFLAAGSVIHATHEAQDLRKLGGLAAHLPRTRLAYLLGCLAIAGFPIAAGFYSKDEILWRAFTQQNVLVPGALLYGVALFTAGLTAFYMFRSYYLVFWARPHDGEPHESPRAMIAVLMVLGALSVVTGAVLGWPEAWGGHPFLEELLRPVFTRAAPLIRFADPGRAVALGLQAASVAVALAGWGLARALYRDLAVTGERLDRWQTRWARLARLLDRKLHVDQMYRWLFVRPALDFAAGFAWIDRHLVDGAIHLAARGGTLLSRGTGWLDRMLVDGAVNAVSAAAIGGGRRLSLLQTGRINNYVLGLAAGAVALVVVTWLVS